jgi:hypothetical protein
MGKDQNVLIFGRDSSTGRPVPISISDGKLVLGSSNTVLGNSPGTTIVVTPTVTAGAYAAGDVVGGRLEFEDAARAAGLGGLITGMTIVDDAGQDSTMELWLFNAQPTDIADNAAFEPPEGDLHNLAGVISTADGSWRAAGTPSACYVSEYLRYDPPSGTSLYGFLVDRTGGTLAATDDITIILHTVQD